MITLVLSGVAAVLSVVGLVYAGITVKTLKQEISRLRALNRDLERNLTATVAGGRLAPTADDLASARRRIEGRNPLDGQQVGSTGGQVDRFGVAHPKRTN